MGISLSYKKLTTYRPFVQLCGVTKRHSCCCPTPPFIIRDDADRARIRLLPLLHKLLHGDKYE